MFHIPHNSRTMDQWSPCCYNLVCLLLFVTAMSQGEATHCSVGVWRRAGEYPGIFSDIFTKYPPAPARRSGGMVPAGRAEKIATVKFSWAGLVAGGHVIMICGEFYRVSPGQDIRSARIKIHHNSFIDHSVEGGRGNYVHNP